MIRNLLNKIALSSLKKKIMKERREVKFNDFIKRAVKFIFVMPENPAEFDEALLVAKYFKIHKKNCTLLLLETSYNRAAGEDFHLIPFNKLETGRLGLPGKTMKSIFQNKNYDVLVNMNSRSDIFVLGLCGLIKAEFKIGFENDLLRECYNFRVKFDEINPEISFRNLLNSLQMF